jgi:citronellol/citronellal dehydrogenase
MARTSSSPPRRSDPHPKLPGTIHSAAREIEAAGGHALPLQVDIRHEDEVEAAVAAAVAAFGGIDILVNNASAISLTGTLATPMKRYDLMQGVNARGTFLCTQKCVPHLTRAANPHVLMTRRLSTWRSAGSRPTSPTRWPSTG